MRFQRMILTILLLVLGGLLQPYFRPFVLWFAPEKFSGTSLPRSSEIIRNPAATEKGLSTQVCKNLHTSICSRKKMVQDPTGIVKPEIFGEREAQKLLMRLSSDHRDWTSKEIQTELAKQIYTPTRTARLRSAFEWSKYAIENYIDKQSPTALSKNEKQVLRQIIKATNLVLPPPADLYADTPDLFVKSDVFYLQQENGVRELRVGGAFLISVTSFFNMVFTFSHELAHAIDPCELAKEKIVLAPYKNLRTCFIQNDLVSMSPERTECSHNDQLSETFADWLAVHITADALLKYATEFDQEQLLHAAMNSVRDLCEDDQDRYEIDTSLHPSPSTRIEKIFAANPKVRKAIGCADDYSRIFCSFNGTKRY